MESPPAADMDDTLVFGASRKSSRSPTETAGLLSAASKVDSLCEAGPPGFQEETWDARSGDGSRQAICAVGLL